MYKELRDEDGILVGVMKDGKASIPKHDGNRDWRKYLAWLAEGNIPEPYRTPEEEVEYQKQLALEEKENMIKDKMRELAIKELEKEGKL